MKLAGIIAEYNPFHNGHKYHIEKTRQCTGATHIVAVMSGNFVQRGNLSLFSKWCRAKVALQNGADLVIELPSAFSCAPAKDFAEGGVYILNKLGVDVISFGSECGDIDFLKETALLSQKARQSEYFTKLIGRGISYPKATELTLREQYSDRFGEVLTRPNDLLGLEYINAVNKISPNTDVFALKRYGAHHDDGKASDNFASASYIREKILDGRLCEAFDFLPENAYQSYLEEISLGNVNDIKYLETPIFYKLRACSQEMLLTAFGVTKELAARLYNASRKASDINELIELTATRRYTKARVRRVIINMLLDNKEDTLTKVPQYARVLALNEKGMEIIKNATQKGDFLISSKFADIYKQGFSQAKYEARATDIYCLAFKDKPCNLEFTKQVYVEK